MSSEQEFDKIVKKNLDDLFFIKKAQGNDVIVESYFELKDGTMAYKGILMNIKSAAYPKEIFVKNVNLNLGREKKVQIKVLFGNAQRNKDCDEFTLHFNVFNVNLPRDEINHIAYSVTRAWFQEQVNEICNEENRNIKALHARFLGN